MKSPIQRRIFGKSIQYALHYLALWTNNDNIWKYTFRWEFYAATKRDTNTRTHTQTITYLHIPIQIRSEISYRKRKPVVKRTQYGNETLNKEQYTHTRMKMGTGAHNTLQPKRKVPRAREEQRILIKTIMNRAKRSTTLATPSPYESCYVVEKTS